MKNQQTQKLTLAAMMTAILIILGVFPGIPLGFIPIPIIIQNMGVLLTTELLGAKYGTLSISLFLALALFGLPVLSGGRGGFAVFLGPTGGYLIAWLLVPVVLGTILYLLKQNNQLSWWLELIVVIVAGVLFIDVIGSIWLSVQSHMPLTTALLSNIAFLPGDMIKAILSVILARRLRKLPALQGIF